MSSEVAIVVRLNVSPKKESQYLPIIERIFFNHYVDGATSVTFAREEINHVADDLGVERIKNLGDIIY